MDNIFPIFFAVYSICTILLFFYGTNMYYMLYLFLSNRKRMVKLDKQLEEDFLLNTPKDKLPMVTTQLPIYNEGNVCERLIRKTAEIDYPKHLHEIQILDDSTDNSKEIIDKVCSELIEKGYDISVIRRKERTEFKAGALKYGMKVAKGEYLAIFDADFLPKKDFLYKTIPHLISNKKTALVQTRWTHINQDYSFLTKAQAIGIDGHFVVEQSARNWGGLLMNFNGTAGIWRKSAIYDAGGWCGDTLTEDMDLSYRAQLAGWEMKYLYHVETPAELPININDFKSQQFRWAKGSIETAKKLLPQIFSHDFSFKQKIQSIFHLTHYSVHLLMLIMAISSLPVLLYLDFSMSTPLFVVMITLLALCASGPSIMYIASQKTIYKSWVKKVASIPILMCIGVGIAINNSKAVMEALIGIKSEFIRTPKTGVIKKEDKKDKSSYSYKIPFKKISFFEILLGLYCAFSFVAYIYYGKYLVGPFLILYSAGFLWVGSFSIIHSIKARN